MLHGHKLCEHIFREVSPLTQLPVTYYRGEGIGVISRTLIMSLYFRGFLTRDFWGIVLNDLDLFVHYHLQKVRQTQLKFRRAELPLRRQHIRDNRNQS